MADRFTLVELTRLKISKLQIEVGGRNIAPTISVGVAEVSSDRSKNDVFCVADKALYLAKSSGRNRSFHESELNNLSQLILQSPLSAVS